jgi:nuclear pore complex protein Nup214
MPTSTPATVQPQSTSNAFSGFSLLGNTTQPQPAVPQSTFQFASKPVASVTSQETQQSQNKPLISVPPTYNPPSQSKPQESSERQKETSSVDIEDEKVYWKMIQDEMKAFDLEFNFIMEKSRSMKVRIGTKEESAEMRRSLEELDDLKREAMETIESLRCDVQSNRLGLTEMFAMLYEAKGKLDQDNNTMIMNKGQDRSTKRKIENLNKMVQQCDIQIQIVVQLLQSQWSNYQDAVNKNKKNRMHIPSLEGVYQTLTKQQEIIYRLSGKLKSIKSKLGICDDVKKQKNANLNATIESLSDSIINISLADQVDKERSKLSEKKLEMLRKCLGEREVTVIKPRRPQMPGLNSEIIIEKKANALKLLRKNVEQPKASVPLRSEPAVKPVMTQKTTQQSVSKPTSESNFNVGQISSQKPQLPTAPSFAQQPIQLSTKKPEESKPFSFATPATTSASSFGSSQPSFGLTTSSSQPNFGTSSSQANFGITATPPQQSFGITSSTTSQPSFGLVSSSQPSFGLTTSASQPSFGIASSTTQPSFSFSSSSLVMNAEKEKKKEEPVKITPQLQKTEQKPPSTISNAPVAVSANFSMSLPSNKTPPKETAVPETKSQSLTSNETTSFTFSLPGKKETAAKPLFGAPSTNVSDSVKTAFSFGSASTPDSTFSFGNLSASKAVPETKTAAVSSSGSIFGSTATTTSSSIFSGSGFSLGDANKASSPPSSNIFAAKSEETKTVSAVPPIFSSVTTTAVADSSDAKPSST